MADVTLQNGTVITEAELATIASAVKQLIAKESKEPSQYEEVTSLDNLTTLPALLGGGSSYKLVRASIELLKGADGKEVSLRSTASNIEWKLGDGEWVPLIDISTIRGESWYQMCVRTGRFTGSEEEFLNEKQQQIDNATTAAASADKASSAANRAAENADDTASHPTYVGEDYYVYAWDKAKASYVKTAIFVRGKNFSVYKTYDSVSAMQADAPNVPSGEFVLISTNTEEEDNAKLYVRTEQGFGYLVDMSGARGATGKTPQISIGSVTAGSGLTDVSVSLSPNGTDKDGNPCYLLDVKIPALNYTDLTEEQKSDLRRPLADEMQALRNVAMRNSNDIDAMIEAKDRLGKAAAISLDTLEWPTLTGLPVTRIGDGVPAIVPDFIGQRYMDTANKKAYLAFGASAVSDWEVMN